MSCRLRLVAPLLKIPGYVTAYDCLRCCSNRCGVRFGGATVHRRRTTRWLASNVVWYDDSSIVLQKFEFGSNISPQSNLVGLKLAAEFTFSLGHCLTRLHRPSWNCRVSIGRYKRSLIPCISGDALLCGSVVGAAASKRREGDHWSSDQQMGRPPARRSVNQQHPQVFSFFLTPASLCLSGYAIW
jgi:hypothetical protein